MRLRKMAARVLPESVLKNQITLSFILASHRPQVIERGLFVHKFDPKGARLL